MNELILYNLSSSKILIIVFLVTFFIIGLFLYWLVNRLRLEKGKIKIHGLLLGINDKGIIVCEFENDIYKDYSELKILKEKKFGYKKIVIFKKI